jgi:hypothetical protein
LVKRPALQRPTPRIKRKSTAHILKKAHELLMDKEWHLKRLSGPQLSISQGARRRLRQLLHEFTHDTPDLRKLDKVRTALKQVDGKSVTAARVDSAQPYSVDEHVFMTLIEIGLVLYDFEHLVTIDRHRLVDTIARLGVLVDVLD